MTLWVIMDIMGEPLYSEFKSLAFICLAVGLSEKSNMDVECTFNQKCIFVFGLRLIYATR